MSSSCGAACIRAQTKPSHDGRAVFIVHATSQLLAAPLPCSSLPTIACQRLTFTSPAGAQRWQRRRGWRRHQPCAMPTPPEPAAQAAALPPPDADRPLPAAACTCGPGVLYVMSAPSAARSTRQRIHGSPDHSTCPPQSPSCPGWPPRRRRSRARSMPGSPCLQRRSTSAPILARRRLIFNAMPCPLLIAPTKTPPVSTPDLICNTSDAGTLHPADDSGPGV